MKRLYISLPITGYDLAEREAYAAEAARHAKNQLMGQHPEIEDLETVTPFDVCPTDTNLEYADYMGQDITALMKCDYVGFCEDWQYSRGCRIERVITSEMGIQAFKVTYKPAKQ